MRALWMPLMLMMLTPGGLPCSSATQSTKDSFSLEPDPRAFSAEMLTVSTCDLLNTLLTLNVIGKFQVIKHIVKLALLDIGTFLLVQ